MRGEQGETMVKGEALSILCGCCSVGGRGPDSDRCPIAQLTNHDRRVAVRWVKGASSFAIFISPKKLKRC